MQTLAHQRCFNHTNREAVALCPQCGRYFCRECVTEHEDMVLCASCMQSQPATTPTAIAHSSLLAHVGQFLVGSIFLWLIFYYLGQILLSIPSSFHEGTIWQINR